jgi:hypothetical protein
LDQGKLRQNANADGTSGQTACGLPNAPILGAADGRHMNLPCIAFAALGFLAGCASVDLRKDGATPAAHHEELRQCRERAATEVPSGDPSMSDAVSIEAEQAMRRRGIILGCMRSKGWK